MKYMHVLAIPRLVTALSRVEVESMRELAGDRLHLLLDLCGRRQHEKGQDASQAHEEAAASIIPMLWASLHAAFGLWTFSHLRRVNHACCSRTDNVLCPHVSEGTEPNRVTDATKYWP